MTKNQQDRLAVLDRPDWATYRLESTHWQASDLLDAALEASRDVSVSRLARLILWASSDVDLVRSKLISVIAVRWWSGLEEAISSLPPNDRSGHTKAISQSSGLTAIGKPSFILAEKSDPLTSTYVWARLEALGRRYPVDRFPHYDPEDSWIADGVRWQIVRYSRRWKTDAVYRKTVLAERSKFRRDHSAH
ncbi:hypothetical protein [Maricaulis sp.]|uniref:hypothetical protein n=1 Tax=Maricaulis sp. TaxID=1486257 RepID=UPI001B11EA66|nr:hypothetical protein [Maricaulis sp.]MBO6798393.1 hypothetical protein [Maricaulis sp.]